MIIWEEKNSFPQLLLHFYSFIQLFLSFLRQKKASEQLHISKKKRTFVKPKLRKLGRRMYKNPNQLILMSDLENKTQEEAPKKRPYNLREKKEKAQRQEKPISTAWSSEERMEMAFLKRWQRRALREAP